MNIGDLIKDKIKILEKEEKELKKKLTELHEKRNKGQNVESIRFKELHIELDEIKRKLKNFRKMVKNS